MHNLVELVDSQIIHASITVSKNIIFYLPCQINELTYDEICIVFREL